MRVLERERHRSEQRDGVVSTCAEVPGVGAGHSLCVDVVAHLLPSVVDARPHVDLEVTNDIHNYYLSTDPVVLTRRDLDQDIEDIYTFFGEIGPLSVFLTSRPED